MVNTLLKHIIARDISAIENDLDDVCAILWCREDYKGFTPLALACKLHLCDDIILKILNKYPEAVRIPNISNGDFPVHVCAKVGASVTAIEALILAWPSVLEIKSKSSIGIMMTPGMLSKGNNNLSEPAKLALRQPVSHWRRLSSTTTRSSQKLVCTRRASSADRHRTYISNVASDDSNTQVNELVFHLHKELQSSKRNEARLNQRLQELESKMDEISLSSSTSSKYEERIKKSTVVSDATVRVKKLLGEKKTKNNFHKATGAIGTYFLENFI